MALDIRSIKGTQDILPADSHKWQYLEQAFLSHASLYGFQEIRIPTFEDRRLFIRSVGDTTDVVQKEMYTFTDQGGRELALRPEGTAGINRAVIESGLIHGPMPLKLCYTTSCFRAEKPQAGRFREFHQLGMEVFGAQSPSADAELISFVDSFLAQLGLTGISLEINSIGCPTCRKQYHDALKAYFAARKEQLCETCLGRLDKSPMRILDCKNPACGELVAEAPVVLDYLCPDCRNHFEGLCRRLDALQISYTVNPRIVRGLDYYNRTVFEFISGDIGAQSTICGGGRYDGLIQSLGGPDQPALGFAMGMERLLMVMEAQQVSIPERPPCDLYLASMGEEASLRAMTLAADLRGEGFIAESDLIGRSLKAQMKYADKIGAAFTMVLGEEELQSGQANLRNMATGETVTVPLDSDEIARQLYNRDLQDLTSGLDLSQLMGMMSE